MTETVDTASPQCPAIALKRRRVTLDDLNQIASLVATRKLTEAEACSIVGIPSKQWYVWKCRAKHSAKFEGIITRMKGDKLKACLDSIDSAGDIVNEKTGQRDWRAKAWLAERLAPERFAQTNIVQQTVTQTPVVVALMSDALKRVFVTDQPKETKALPQATDAAVIDVAGNGS